MNNFYSDIAAQRILDANNFLGENSLSLKIEKVIHHNGGPWFHANIENIQLFRPQGCKRSFNSRLIGHGASEADAYIQLIRRMSLNMLFSTSDLREIRTPMFDFNKP